MLTVIIPTMNRPDFLRRLLNYYAQASFGGWLFVGDASMDLYAQKVQRIVEEYQGKIHLRYEHLPGQSIAQTLAYFGPLIQTPYVVLNPDDDLFVFSGLQRCEDFLNGNPSYTAANGQAALFLIENGKPCGAVQDLGDYPLMPSENEDPVARLEEFLEYYWVALFSVHRTSVWQQMWHYGSGIKDVAFAAELLPNCLSIIAGKIKHLNTLYLFRQEHERRYTLTDAYDWQTSYEWQNGYQIFSNTLIETLVNKGIDKKRAQQAVKKAFWGYLSSCLTGQFKNQYCRLKTKDNFKEACRNLPGIGDSLAKGLSNIQKIRLSFSRNITLNGLLNKSHPEYAQFQMVYKAITYSI